MSLSSLQLDAFLSVAKLGSFSGAARELGISQSALSQRILNLESELEATLFTRDITGSRVTEVGQRLLRYCQSKENMEQEFLQDFVSGRERSPRGVARIGGASSLVRSLLIPTLGLIAQKHPAIQFDVMTRELSELRELLASSRADLLLTCEDIQRPGLISQRLGWEENVLVQSKKKRVREDVCLDHDEKDQTTFDFFRSQTRRPRPFRREYFDDIYTLLEGAMEGLGRAVIPRHLFERSEGLMLVPGWKALKTGVYLCYFEQSYYTALHKLLVEEISSEVTRRLAT